MESPSPLLYLLIVALLCFSAFFSASETAISTMNRMRLKKKADEGSKRAKTALAMNENYDRTLFSILIGNNLVNIAGSSIATIIATYWFGVSGALVSTITMTVLVLVFGEVLPKSYSNDHSEQVALALSPPLRWIIRLLTPITWLFMRLKSAFMRTPPPKGPTLTEQELLYMLESIEEEGVIEEQERDLVQSALEFDEITIREILTPRVDIAAVDINDSPEEILQVVLGEGYSRVPVFEGSIDNIVGILFTRDYLRHIVEHGAPPELRPMLGDPLFVHRTLKLSDLLAELKANKVNLAVVTDDYGGTLGIVTMEDVLEELVGEIWDEDDEIKAGIVRTGETSCEVPGSYNLRELFEAIGLDQDMQDHGYSTVNGWAMNLFEHIPHIGEQTCFGNLELTILEMDGHRIKRLSLAKKAGDEPQAEPGSREEQAEQE